MRARAAIRRSGHSSDYESFTCDLLLVVRLRVLQDTRGRDRRRARPHRRRSRARLRPAGRRVLGPEPAKPVPAQLPDVLARVNGEAVNKTEFDRAVVGARGAQRRPGAGASSATASSRGARSDRRLQAAHPGEPRAQDRGARRRRGRAHEGDPGAVPLRGRLQADAHRAQDDARTGARRTSGRTSPSRS